MKRSLPPIICGSVAAIAAIAAQPAAAGALGARPASLPRLVTTTWSGIKPTEIAFSADGGDIVTGIKWSSWTATGAVGHGTSEIQTCVPNCATGGGKDYPTTVTLSRPQSGHFTRIVELRDHQRDTFTYPRDWPGGAAK